MGSGQFPRHYCRAFGTGPLITAHCRAGDHVVLPDDLYGGTYRLVHRVLTRWGLEYTIVDQRDLDAVAAAVRRGRTTLVWVETPTNPTLKVIDVAGVSALISATNLVNSR